MDLYEKLTSHEAVENCFPKFIARVNGVNTVLATVVDGSVYLTDEGKQFLAEPEAPVVEKPARQRKSKVTVVEPVVDEVPADETVTDFEIGGDLNFDE